MMSLVEVALCPLQLETLDPQEDEEEDDDKFHDLAQDSAGFSYVANLGHGEDIC